MDLEGWAISMLEHNKRKSHLAAAQQQHAREKLRERSPREPHHGPREQPRGEHSPASSATERTPTSYDSRYSEARMSEKESRDSRFADTNGGEAVPRRPSYPVRTSSASSGQNLMSLPIRPAPAPGVSSPQIRGTPNGALPPASRRWNNEA